MSFGRVMLECTRCCEWYHKDCIEDSESIPDDTEKWNYIL